ncbi:MAG: S1C family serine protease [Puniceicoccales bacterium]|jgi:putative serine protease PepD|nr:S1C family serine protease [Puniceicoccales bacterium]
MVRQFLVVGALLCLAPSLPAQDVLSAVAPQVLQPAEEIFTAHRDAVVRVVCLHRREDGSGGARTGSGFFLDAAGHVATTAGAIEGAEEIWIEFGPHSIRAGVVGVDLRTNVAVLAPVEESPPQPCFSLGDGTVMPKTLTPLLAIACEIGLDPSPAIGIALAEQICHGNHCFATTHLRSSLPSNAGAPGSPVFDLQGNFVGMLMASIPQIDGSFLLPARAIRRVVQDLLRHGEVRYAYVGLDTCLERDGDGQFAVLVRDVIPNSPAAEANLLAEDRILAINDMPIRGPADLRNAIFFAPPESPIAITVRRGSDIFRLFVRTIGCRPGEEVR